MSSLSMRLPETFPVSRPEWLANAGAAAVALVLHIVVFGLLLHGWTPELSAPTATQVLRTQLISLPPKPLVAPEPEPEPLAQARAEPVPIEPPPLDPRIEQQRL